MSTCPNCNTALSCSCKLRTASNGHRVCTTCQQAYENALKIASLKTNPPDEKLR